jgi:hypothetical protein
VSWIVTLALLIGLVTWGRGREHQSFGSRLRKLLDEAVTEQALTEQQRSRLIEIAERHCRKTALSASTWVAILAGLFVVAGLSLIIAHNWESIGALSRVLAFLVLFAAVGETALRVGSKSRGLQLGMEFVWFSFPLLGIGLYAQSFQLSGDPIRPFLVWLLLTLPLSYWVSSPYVGRVHLVALITVLFSGNLMSGMLSLDSIPPGTWSHIQPLAWGLTVVIWGVLFLQAKRFLPSVIRNQFLALFLIWLFSLLLGSTPFRVYHTAWLFAAGMGFSTIWMLFPLLISREGVAQSVGAVPWLGLVYAMTFLWHVDSVFTGETSVSGLVLSSLAVAGALFLALFAPLTSWKLSGIPAMAVRALVVVVVLLSLLGLQGEVWILHAIGVAANFLLAAIAGLLMWHGSKILSAWAINAGVALLVLLLITRFFDVLGDMVRSGVGLIVAGLILGAIGYVAEKGRRKLLVRGREPRP